MLFIDISNPRLTSFYATQSPSFGRQFRDSFISTDSNGHCRQISYFVERFLKYFYVFQIFYCWRFHYCRTTINFCFTSWPVGPSLIRVSPQSCVSYILLKCLFASAVFPRPTHVYCYFKHLFILSLFGRVIHILSKEKFFYPLPPPPRDYVLKEHSLITQNINR